MAMVGGGAWANLAPPAGRLHGGMLAQGPAGVAAVVQGVVLARVAVRRSLRLLVASRERGRVFWRRRSSRALHRALGTHWV